jgi:hypothetical protein
MRAFWILSICSAILLVDAVDWNCNYGSDKTYGYFCVINNARLTQIAPVNIIGKHQHSKTDRDVKLFEIVTHTIAYIPPEIFAKFPSLVYLDIERKNLQVLTVDSFHNAKNLKMLVANYNQLKVLGPKVFSGAGNLEIIRLGVNAISEINENAFWGLRKLREINLGTNKIWYLHRNTFQFSSHLEYLYLDQNVITSLWPNMFKNVVKFRYLKLSGNLCINKDFENIAGNSLEVSMLSCLRPKALYDEFNTIETNSYRDYSVDVKNAKDEIYEALEILKSEMSSRIDNLNVSIADQNLKLEKFKLKVEEDSKKKPPFLLGAPFQPFFDSHGHSVEDVEILVQTPEPEFAEEFPGQISDASSEEVFEKPIEASKNSGTHEKFPEKSDESETAKSNVNISMISTIPTIETSSKFPSSTQETTTEKQLEIHPNISREIEDLSKEFEEITTIININESPNLITNLPEFSSDFSGTTEESFSIFSTIKNWFGISLTEAVNEGTTTYGTIDFAGATEGYSVAPAIGISSTVDSVSGIPEIKIEHSTSTPQSTQASIELEAEITTTTIKAIELTSKKNIDELPATVKQEPEVPSIKSVDETSTKIQEDIPTTKLPEITTSRIEQKIGKDFEFKSIFHEPTKSIPTVITADLNSKQELQELRQLYDEVYQNLTHDIPKQFRGLEKKFKKLKSENENLEKKVEDLIQKVAKLSEDCQCDSKNPRNEASKFGSKFVFLLIIAIVKIVLN